MLRPAIAPALLLLSLLASPLHAQEAVTAPASTPATSSAVEEKAAPAVAEQPPAERKQESAQQEERPIQTLVSGDIKHGGFGGPTLRFGQVLGETAVLVGGRGGWLIDQHFVLGGGGMGLSSEISVPVPALQTLYDKVFLGYGGVYLQYIFWPEKVVHMTLGSLFASGGVGYSPIDNDFIQDISTSIWVIEPEISAELNITSFMRLLGGVSYRAVTGVDIVGMTNADLSGINGVLMLEFGGGF